jgi:hypothetical protein
LQVDEPRRARRPLPHRSDEREIATQHLAADDFDAATGTLGEQARFPLQLRRT